MNMDNIILSAVLLLIVGAAIAFIVKEKRRGVKCIGCPAGATCGKNCSGCQGGCTASKK